MSSEKTDAVVLRIVPFSETSLVVTMLSRDFGKISALAKGARRPKSPFEGSLDLGCHCRVVFIKKASDSLSLLTEAKLQRRFRAANRSIQRLYCGYYVIELLRELTEEDQEHPELFDLALATLTNLDSADEDLENSYRLLSEFELQLLKVMGHAPSLGQCAACGEPVGSHRRVAFGMLAGGVVCGRCRPHQRQIVMVSDPARQLMRSLLEGSSKDQTQMNPVDGEIRGVLNRYISHHVGRPLRMQKLVSHQRYATTSASQ